MPISLKLTYSRPLAAIRHTECGRQKVGSITTRSTPMQTSLLTPCVRRQTVRNRVSRTILKVSLMALLLSGCAAHSRPTTLTVEEVVRKSSQYDGRSISLLACLNVTRHTMTLVDCGMPTTEIAFESTKGKEAGYR